MLISWSLSLPAKPETPSHLVFLLYNKYIIIEGVTIHFAKLSNKDNDLLSQLFENGRIISWFNLKDRYK